MLQIIFEFSTEYGMYRDALYLPEDHAFSEAEIQAMKEQRRDAWIAVVSNPPTEPAAEDLQTSTGQI